VIERCYIMHGVQHLFDAVFDEAAVEVRKRGGFAVRTPQDHSVASCHHVGADRFYLRK